MTTTATPAPTVNITGIGDVPALPAHLHPVAELAADMPLRTWGVVGWAGGMPPTLLRPAILDQVNAQRYAFSVLGLYDRLYVVQRLAHGVTVHSYAISHRGNTLGSLPAYEATRTSTVDAWTHAVVSLVGGADALVEHLRNVEEAQRIAHGLPAGTDRATVLHAVKTARLPSAVYLAAYAAVLGNPDALHAHAINRSTPTHR